MERPGLDAEIWQWKRVSAEKEGVKWRVVRWERFPVSPGNGRLTYTVSQYVCCESVKFILQFIAWVENFRLSQRAGWSGRNLCSHILKKHLPLLFGNLNCWSLIDMLPADVPPEVNNKVKTINNWFKNDRRLFSGLEAEHQRLASCNRMDWSFHKALWLSRLPQQNLMAVECTLMRQLRMSLSQIHWCCITTKHIPTMKGPGVIQCYGVTQSYNSSTYYIDA